MRNPAECSSLFIIYVGMAVLPGLQLFLALPTAVKTHIVHVVISCERHRFLWGQHFSMCRHCRETSYQRRRVLFLRWRLAGVLALVV